jgi:multiple sugar transport system ATP-binding protein
MAQVELRNVVKKFDSVVAVNGVNITAEDEQFVVFLGPSGCGKTTCLRMIAGLEIITEGDIYIGNKKVNDVAPKDRDIAMVFQNYALYPHMSVFKNMALGLQLKKFPKDQIETRVLNAAKVLNIEDLLERKPRALSGGQRQRVAMGRAIVREPQVFLFDEPLSNLDAKLRLQMRVELAKLHKKLGKTIIYVTHDQIEAMTLADKIVIINEGEVMQEGRSLEIYNNPANLFVADFIGSPSMNLLEVVLVGEGDNLYVRGNGFKLLVPENRKNRYAKYKDQKAVFGIRPEHVNESGRGGDSPGQPLDAFIEVVEPMGSGIILSAKCGDDSLTASVDPRAEVEVDTQIQFRVDMNEMHLFDKETHKVI